MIRRLDHQEWGADGSGVNLRENITAELEGGAVLLLAKLSFAVRADEQVHFSPSIAVAKNVSFDPGTGRLGGMAPGQASRASLGVMLRRFSDAAGSLVNGLFPSYAGK